MNWLALGALYVLWRWGWSKHDPRRCAEKRGLAWIGLGRSGLETYAGNVRPEGNGLCFTVAPDRRADFLARITDRGWRAGGLYWFHSDKAKCNLMTDCKDYRSDNGVVGQGSLQIVYNRRTGDGFVDYDQFSPYQSWSNFMRHAEEI